MIYDYLCVLNGCVPVLSGEWPGDEEVDGRAFSYHHGHATGLLLISQETGMQLRIIFICNIFS